MIQEKLKSFIQKLSRRKPYPNPDRKPINLHVIEDKSPEKIIGMLRDDIPIWAWYDGMKARKEDGSMNLNALYALEKGYIDGFFMYRKEGDFLCKYDTYIFENDPKFHMKLKEIRAFKNSNVLEICNEDFKDARELYYDVEGLTEEQYSYQHDLTEEYIRESLSHNLVLYVTDEHFIRKEDAL